MKETEFLSKSVIITGASSGIGKALALRLASEGAWVALAARDAARLEALAQECEKLGGRAVAIPTDVSDEAQCRVLAERTVAAFGRIDMLVNNAGISVTALLEEFADLSLFKQVMDVNFYGMVYCTYYALPHLITSKGRLVNVSSLGGKLAVPHNSAYISSKFAMHGFSDTLRMELVKHGVSVTVVCPYWVVTEFHERYMDKHGKPRGPSGRAIYTEKMMTADQCAGIILKAAAKRKREVLMRPGPLAVWLKMFAPGLVDKLTLSVFLRPAIKRAKAGKT